jgi:hypothetical protein
VEIADSQLVVETVAEEKVEKNHRAVCPRCGIDYLRRMSRSGFLQRVIYPIFGYYPWRCRVCRGSYMIKKRGKVDRQRRTHSGR